MVLNFPASSSEVTSRPDCARGCQATSTGAQGGTGAIASASILAGYSLTKVVGITPDKLLHVPEGIASMQPQLG